MDKSKSVLIIDDDMDFLLMISIMLVNRGFEVRCLLSGQDHSLFNYAMNSDILLIDVNLPGINGCDLGRQLKSDSRTGDIPIILVRGYAMDHGDSKSYGADAFMEKPFHLSHLLGKIEQLLNSYLRPLEVVTEQ
jgi:adenylate cyclase